MKLCKYCNLEKPADGKWHGSKCHDCRKADHITRARRLGHKPIDDCTDHRNALGRESERVAIEHLKSLGCEVSGRSNVRGPDITFQFVGKTMTAEVKTVTDNKGLSVQAVKPRRRNDDFIIFVHQGIVVIEKMSEHLLECCSGGKRYVTRLFRGTYTPNQGHDVSFRPKSSGSLPDLALRDGNGAQHSNGDAV